VEYGTAEIGPVECAPDGGFVVPYSVGWVEAEPRSHLWHVEPDGTTSWDLEEQNLRYARVARADPNGGYVVVGQDYDGGLFGHDCFALLRVSAAGQTIRVMKTEAGDGRALDVAPDGNYVLAGIKDLQPCVLKLDTLGAVIWSGQVADLRGVFTAVIATADGGVLAAGVARDVDGSRGNVVLVKFNPPEE
jgi:hypothetical protein